MKTDFAARLAEIKTRSLTAIFSDDYFLGRLALKGGTAIECVLDGGLQRASLA